MKKKLTKSNSNIVVSGVLGGIGEFFGIDPTIVRIVYLALSLFTAGFPGFFLYILLAIIVPSQPAQHQTRENYYGNYYGDGMNRRPGNERKQATKVDDDEDEWSDF